MNQQRTRALGHFLALLTVVAVLGAAGCAGGKRASISGHVNYQGRPVTSGTVVLIGQDGQASAPGNVQPDGSFSIARAPVGVDKVSFDNPPPPRTAPPVGKRAPADDPEYAETAKAAAHYVPTPPKFKDPLQSGLTVEVKSGNNTCDIELK